MMNATSFTFRATASALLLGGLLCSLPACSESRADADARSRLSTEDPNAVSAVPVSDEQIDEAIRALPGLIERAMRESGVPGIAAAVVHRDRLVFAEGYGVRDTESGAAVDPDTVFPLASISKPVGATVVAAEIGAGTVDWDTPITQWLPDFRLGNPAITPLVTVGDLYAHRSGLPDHAAEELETLGFSREEILARLHHLPLARFRLDYAYTNYGLAFAAYAVSEAAGIDWATLSERRLYEPLGMRATSSRHADYLAHPKRARMHARKDGAWLPLFEFDSDRASPAGGVSSSARDMAAWMRMVLARGRFEGKQVVDADALLEALRPQSVAFAGEPASRPSFYGYGFMLGSSPSGRTVLSHSGAFLPGAATMVQLFPSLDLGLVLLSNGQPIGVVERLAGEFSDLVQFGEARTDWRGIYEPAFAAVLQPHGDLGQDEAPKEPAPPQALDRYTGRYESAYFGEAEVVLRDGALELLLGPSKQRWPLRHWDGDVFAMAIPEDIAPAGSRSSVRFAPTLESFTVHYFDDHGLGTFIRP